MIGKAYLGDAVYAEMEHGMIKLTTVDGITSTNEIFLEMEVYDSLVRFMDRVKQDNKPADPVPEEK